MRAALGGEKDLQTPAGIGFETRLVEDPVLVEGPVLARRPVHHIPSLKG